MQFGGDKRSKNVTTDRTHLANEMDQMYVYMWNIFICIFIQTLYHDCYLPFDLSLPHFTIVHRYFLYSRLELAVRNSEEELLTISQDGFVMLYTIKSKYLIGCRQLQISLHDTSVPLQMQANR